MFENYPDVVDVTAVCEMLGVGRNFAYRLIRLKEIHSMRVGRKIRIPKSEVIKYVNKHCIDTE